MIDPATYSAQQSRLALTGQTSSAAAAPPRPTFRMIENDRMAGSIPAWVRPNTPQDKSVAALSNAASDVTFSDEMSNALAYQQGDTGPHDINDEPFGFGDLVDIVNPLHHIPLVGTLYRHLTGDQIRPSSQIIGGTLFGGALGAASGIANAIMQEETGSDIGEHALQIAGLADEATPHSGAQRSAPVTQLAAAEIPQQKGGELPASALSYADLSYIEPAAGHPAFNSETANTPSKPIPSKPSALAAQYRFNN
jgi:hypothetical protein